METDLEMVVSTAKEGDKKALEELILKIREHRLAYLLADVFEVSSEQGAAILDITPIAFRKRLSRSRERVQDFLTRNCTLINPNNPCKCERFVGSFLDDGKMDLLNSNRFELL